MLASEVVQLRATHCRRAMRFSATQHQWRVIIYTSGSVILSFTKEHKIFFFNVAQHLVSMTHDQTHTCSDTLFLKLKCLTIFRAGTVRLISTYKT